MHIRQIRLLIVDLGLLVLSYILVILLKFGFFQFSNRFVEDSLWFWLPIIINIVWKTVNPTNVVAPQREFVR